MLFSAIIGIRHRLPHSPLYMVEQQRQFRLAVRRPHAAQVGEVFGIQRNDVIEPAEIVGGHLSRSQMRDIDARSEEHTSELQSLMRISYAVFCLKKKITNHKKTY